MTTIPKYANAELVTVAALKEKFGDGFIGTTLPTDSTGWTEFGFVQVTSIAGNTNPYVGMVSSAMSIDVWAAPRANKPPWGKANNTAEAVRRWCLLLRPHRLVLPGEFPDALVYTAQMLTEPRRVPDPGHFARYNFNIMVHWSNVELS